MSRIRTGRGLVRSLTSSHTDRKGLLTPRSQPAATSPLWLGQQVTLGPQEKPPWGCSLWEHRERGPQQRGQDTLRARSMLTAQARGVMASDHRSWSSRWLVRAQIGRPPLLGRNESPRGLCPLWRAGDGGSRPLESPSNPPSTSRLSPNTV